MTHNFDEIQLIEQCKEGKRMAQKAIYERYAPSMLSICVRYVSDNETAKDVLQDGFIKAFTSIRSFSGTGSFGGWLRRIFVTTSLEFYGVIKNGKAANLSIFISIRFKRKTTMLWQKYRPTNF